ncbi:MAG: ATP-binding protein [Cyanobacteria bacterium P01_G01_bin.54]
MQSTHFQGQSVRPMDWASVPHDVLPASASTQWQAQNLSYLMQAIMAVRVTLKSAAGELEEAANSDVDEINQSLAAIAAAMSTPPHLEQVSTIFGLSRFEQMILLCCVGQALDPAFPGLLANAQSLTGESYTTIQLAMQCFADPHWSAVTERRPLRAWQLVHWASHPEPSRAALQIDEAILHHLMGEPYHDPVVTAMLKPHSPLAGQTPLQPSHQTLLEQMVVLLQTSQAAPLLQLCGTLRDLQWAIAHQVSEQLQWPSYRLPSDAIPSDRADLQNLIRRWQRWVKLQPSLLCLEITTITTAAGSQPPLVEAFLDEINVPLLIITDGRLPFTPRSMMTFEVTGLQYGEQLQLWRAAWPERDPTFELELARLASQFRLSAPLIQTASAAVQADETSPAAEWGDRLWDFCRAQARPQLEGLAQPITINATWEDLILPQREKSLLHQITTHVRQQAQVYQQWGFASKNQRGLGLTALFAGVSGTGKTTAAEILAHELNLDLFRIDLSAIMSKYIGETEKNLRKIFDAAEVGGAILLFDEADALFGKRTQVKDSHDRHANIEVSYLLQRMEAYQGLAILTTNLKDNLDQAFLRRLRFILNFPYPKQPERSQIWARVFPAATPTKGLDFELLGQLDVTGGNIKAIALNAAFLAAEAGKPVTMQHILEATRTEYWKLGRSLTNTEIQYWEVD